MTTQIKQALLSVSDKRGIVELARALNHQGVKLLSTGGTAKSLTEAGIPVTEISSYTGFPEMLDGRVKTLHPKVHGGILARRDLPAHMQAIAAADIPPIDLVVVNLYPFTQAIETPGCTLDHAIENIDIGGPTMVRAAAKNYGSVAVLTDPDDYSALLDELQREGGAVSATTRFALAKKAFAHTAAYDMAIANYLTSLDEHNQPGLFPERLGMQWHKQQKLRYGENPHQQAAFYRDASPVAGGLANYTQLQGKALSYNNIADADTAWECVKTFEQAACVIVKHANPCGVAQASDALSAYRLAYSTDPTSAFGGILAFNCTVDAAAAEALTQQFVEVLIAPSFSAEALRLMERKGNVRVLQVPLERAAQSYDCKRVGGGLLVQTSDTHRTAIADFKLVSKRAPTGEELNDLLFAWRVVKYVKSNAIVFCRGGMTLGVGAGQMSRVDSARMASIKAHNAAHSLAGSVVASDAFFPFSDGVEVVAEAGARAIVQPGGSMHDNEVIAAADARDIAMVFTGVRHFRH